MIRASLTGKRCALALAIAIAGMTTGPVQAQGPEEVWSLDSDGTWQARVISLGNDGTQVFTGQDGYISSRRLLSSHDSNPPSPVWTNVKNQFVIYSVVDSARVGNVHAEMHQEYMDDTSTWRKAVLSKYSSDSSAPDWSYEFGIPIMNHDRSLVKVSDDGSRLVGVVYDTASDKNRVAVFGEDGPVPLIEFDVDTFVESYDFSISKDGSTATFVSTIKMVVVDLNTGTTLMETYVMGQAYYGALDMSSDGSTMAVCTASTVRVYRRTGAGPYSQVQSLAVPAGAFCRRLALADDGSTLAITANYFAESSRILVRVVDVLSGTVYIDHSITGAGTFSNLVADVKLSTDGRRVALGSWGDGTPSTPELVVYELGSATPVWTQDLVGSVMAIDFAPDGDRLAVAMKGCHATQLGGGGAFKLFSTRGSSFVLHGVPSIGTTVTFEQYLPTGSIARVICSPALSEAPAFFDGVGTLYLQRCAAMQFLPHGAQNSSDVYETPLVIPNDPNLIGTTTYFQGLSLAPRGLSDNYVKVTYLP